VPVELIILEFGKPVGDIVMDLLKEERKHRQIQAALKMSRKAKLIKTNYQPSNRRIQFCS